MQHLEQGIRPDIGVPTEYQEQPQGITPDVVTNFYNFRTALLGAQTPGKARSIAAQHGFPTDPAKEFDPKKVLIDYYKSHFEPSKTVEEHAERLNTSLNGLIEHLTLEQSRAMLWVFGSFAKGKINGTHSDLDYILVVPKIEDPNARKQEIEKFRKLSDLGYIISEELGPVEDMDSIMQNGQGLARLYAFTREGLEVEFHILGIDDASQLGNLDSEAIKRVRPTAPKNETRVSFKGKRKELPKASDSVVNYSKDDESKDIFVGFFPSSMIYGELLYDPESNGEEIDQAAWLGVVEGFLYQNAGLTHNEYSGEYYIRRRAIDFDKFLSILYYPNKEDYSKPKLEELRRKFWNTTGRLFTRIREESRLIFLDEFISHR